MILPGPYAGSKPVRCFDEPVRSELTQGVGNVISEAQADHFENKAIVWAGSITCDAFYKESFGRRSRILSQKKPFSNANTAAITGSG